MGTRGPIWQRFWCIVCIIQGWRKCEYKDETWIKVGYRVDKGEDGQRLDKGWKKGG
jgi:hypothetical protein